MLGSDHSVIYGPCLGLWVLLVARRGYLRPARIAFIEMLFSRSIPVTYENCENPNSRKLSKRTMRSLAKGLSVMQREYAGKSGASNTKLEGVFALCRVLSLKMPFRCAQLTNVSHVICIPPFEGQKNSRANAKI